MRKNVTKLYISASSVHKYHKSCSLLIWTFYGLLQQYEIKMSQNRNLCPFCAQVSQNVLLADLTVLIFITTVWAKMSQNSCLGEFCAQASHFVFVVDLTVFGLLQVYEEKCHKTHIYASSVNKYHKSCSSFIWPFYGLLQLYVWRKLSQNSYLRELCSQVS